MHPSHKAFYFLIDLEEWKLAYEFSKNIKDLNCVHLNLIRLVNNKEPKDDCSDWVYEINEQSIFNYTDFIKDNKLDYYSQKLVYKIMEIMFNDHFHR